jgi:hypothetical protein
MGLMDRLRKAEEQGMGTARRGFERARETWDDAQRRLRRRMRVLPRPAASHRVDEAASGKLTPPASPTEMPRRREPEIGLAENKERERSAA